MDDVHEEALVMILEITKALARGTKHYRKSDNKELLTAREIVETLLKEGVIELEPCNSKSDLIY